MNWAKLLILASVALSTSVQAADLKQRKSSPVSSEIILEIGQTATTLTMVDLPVDHQLTINAARDLSGLGLYTTSYTIYRQNGQVVTEVVPVGRQKLTYGQKADVTVARRPIDAKYRGRGQVVVTVD
jgi:hypothetical protein